jgi:hypothetical protein
MAVSPRFGRGVSTDDSPGVVSLLSLSFSLVRACSLFPRSRSLAGALFVDWGRLRNCGRSDLFFWIHRAVLWHQQAFLCVVWDLSLSFSIDILCEIEAVVVEARNGGRLWNNNPRSFNFASVVFMHCKLLNHSLCLCLCLCLSFAS